MNQISLTHSVWREGPECSLRSPLQSWPPDVLLGQEMSSYLPSCNPSCRDKCSSSSYDFLTHQKGGLFSSSHILIIFFTVHWLLNGKVCITNFGQMPQLLTNFVFILLMSNPLLIKICLFKPKMSSDALSFYVFFSGVIICYFFVFIFMYHSPPYPKPLNLFSFVILFCLYLSIIYITLLTLTLHYYYYYYCYYYYYYYFVINYLSLHWFDAYSLNNLLCLYFKPTACLYYYIITYSGL